MNLGYEDQTREISLIIFLWRPRPMDLEVALKELMVDYEDEELRFV